MRTRKGSKFKKPIKVAQIKNPIAIPESPKRTWDLPEDLMSVRRVIGFPNGLATVPQMEDFLKTDVGQLMPKTLRDETEEWLISNSERKRNT